MVDSDDQDLSLSRSSLLWSAESVREGPPFADMGGNFPGNVARSSSSHGNPPLGPV